MAKKKIIAMLGVAGSGKNAAADFIRGFLPGTSQLAFSDPIKELAALVFEFPIPNLWGKSELRNENFAEYAEQATWDAAFFRFDQYGPEWATKVLLTFKGSPEHLALVLKMTIWFMDLQAESLGKGLTPRRMLQTLGTECARAVDPNIWAHYGLAHAQRLLVGEKRTAVVITDCRFINEARLVRAQEGEVWFMDRPVPGLEGDAGKHQSEVEIRTPEMQQYVTQTFRNAGSLEDLRGLIEAAVRTTFGR